MGQQKLRETISETCNSKNLCGFESAVKLSVVVFSREIHLKKTKEKHVNFIVVKQQGPK